MKRREFITALGGAAVWPRAAQAQQSSKIYRIGYLTANLSSYPWVKGFVRELSDRGYGPAIDGIWRRGAYFVEKILNGAKPSDLPVEGPSEFHLAINLKAAKDMGLSVPQHLVGRADELIKADVR